MFINTLLRPWAVARRHLPTDTFQPLPALGAQSRNTLPPDAVAAARRGLVENLARQAVAGDTVLFFFDTPGTADRFRETAPASLQAGIRPTQPLSGGFHSAALRLWVVAESDLYGQKIRRRRPAAGRFPCVSPSS